MAGPGQPRATDSQRLVAGPACERPLPDRMHDQLVRLSSGRELAVRADGADAGRPVFVLHGNPGSRFLFPLHVEDARRHGLRLIGYDRPGYGGSTEQPGRRIGDAASDVASIADRLGIERFGVWGHSMGGPHALACAALLPDRVVGASSLAAPAPFPAEGLDWVAGMGEFNVTDFRLMLDDPAGWRAKLERDRTEMLSGRPEAIGEVFASLLSNVDRAAMTPEVSRFLASQVAEGLRSGAAGTRDDSLSEALPWGFDLASIRVPVQLWHGEHDLFSPFAHGQWLARRIPGVEAHLLSTEGHLSLLTGRIPEVHRWLASRF